MLQKIGQALNKFKGISSEMRKAKSKTRTEEENEVEKKEDASHALENSDNIVSNKVTQQTEEGELSSEAILAKIGVDSVQSKLINNEQLAKGSQDQAALLKREGKPINDRDKLNSYITKTMNDYKYANSDSTQNKESPVDEEALIEKMKEIQQDLSEALEHWKWTKHAYQHAVEFEQVEYCIYQMMAAEQKYRMILLKARNMNVDWSKVKGDMI